MELNIHMSKAHHCVCFGLCLQQFLRQQRITMTHPSVASTAIMEPHSIHSLLDWGRNSSGFGASSSVTLLDPRMAKVLSLVGGCTSGQDTLTRRCDSTVRSSPRLM